VVSRCCAPVRIVISVAAIYEFQSKSAHPRSSVRRALLGARAGLVILAYALALALRAIGAH
jgi:hypothetical protein